MLFGVGQRGTLKDVHDRSVGFDGGRRIGQDAVNYLNNKLLGGAIGASATLLMIAE